MHLNHSVLLDDSCFVVARRTHHKSNNAWMEVRLSVIDLVESPMPIDRHLWMSHQELPSIEF